MESNPKHNAWKTDIFQQLQANNNHTLNQDYNALKKNFESEAAYFNALTPTNDKVIKLEAVIHDLKAKLTKAYRDAALQSDTLAYTTVLMKDAKIALDATTKQNFELDDRNQLLEKKLNHIQQKYNVSSQLAEDQQKKMVNLQKKEDELVIANRNLQAQIQALKALVSSSNNAALNGTPNNNNNYNSAQNGITPTSLNTSSEGGYLSNDVVIRRDSKNSLHSSENNIADRNQKGTPIPTTPNKNNNNNYTFVPSSVPTKSPFSKSFQSNGYPSSPSPNFLSSPLPSTSHETTNTNMDKTILSHFNFTSPTQPSISSSSTNSQTPIENNNNTSNNNNVSTPEILNNHKQVPSNMASVPNLGRSSNIDIRVGLRQNSNVDGSAHSLPAGNGELVRFHSMPNFKPKFNPVTFSTKMVISGRPIDAHKEVNCSSFHLSGEILATGGSDQSVKLWDTSNLGGVPVYRKQLSGPTSSVLNVQFSPHSNVLSGTSNDKNVYIWEPSGKEIHILTGHTEKVTCVTYLDEKTLGSCSWDRYLRFFDLHTGFSTGSYHLGSRMNSACVGPFSCTVVTGHIDKKLRIFDYRNGNTLHTIEAHARDITCVVSCPDIPYLVLTSSKDNTLKISDLRTLEVLTTFKHAEYKNQRDINLVCFSPNGKFVVAGGEEGKIFFWNRLKGVLENLITTNNTNSIQRTNKSCISSVSWNPKRNQLIACLDSALYLYDGETVQ